MSTPRVDLPVCDRPQGYMPPGSYTKTCPSRMFVCTKDKDELTAECKGTGRLIRSTLPDASLCLDVRNESGVLKCHRRIRRMV